MILPERKQDILDDILNTPDVHHGAVLEELSRLIHYHTQSSLKPNPIKRSVRRKKTTHYLSCWTFETLGAAKKEIRELLPSVPKSKISKSGIVNYALLHVLNEFKENGSGSPLIKQIVNQKQNNQSR